MSINRYDEVLSEFGVYEEGTINVMVCDNSPESLALIVTAIKDLGFKEEIPASLNDALDRLKYNKYEIVFLSEGFSGSSPGGNKVLEHFNRMSMVNRQNTFIMLIGNNYSTLSNIEAFSKSVNAVINIKDLPNMKEILKRSLSDNDLFYSAYKDVLRDLKRG